MKKFLGQLEENFMLVMLPGTCIIITLQVLGRYTGLFNMHWAEELVRYMYIWVAFVGISLGVKSNAHFNVQVVLNLFPVPVRKIIQTINTIIVILFLLLMVYHSIILLRRIVMMTQTSPMMGISMAIPYAAITAGCFTMAVRVLLKMIHDIRYPNEASGKGEE